MTGPVLVVALLATYRLVMLWRYDVISERPVKAIEARLQRRKHPDAVPVVGTSWAMLQEDVIIRRAEDPHWLVKLGDCNWCTSWWVALPVVGSAWVWGDRWWWFVPAGALAASAVTGILADLSHPEGRKDPVP